MNFTTPLSNTLDVPARRPSFLNVSVATEVVASDVLISDEATRLFSWVAFIVCEVVAVFGIVANILNIICFVRLDLKDPINVSFLGLSISDLGCVATMLWTCFCMLPGVREMDLPFDSIEFQYLITGYPHVVFTRVTSWITALVTLERCLCVTMPLKVKSIMTSKRVMIIIIGIFAIVVLGVSPIYYSCRLAWVFSPERNRTMLKVIYTDDRSVVEPIAHAITNVFVPFSAYATVIICTVVLVIKLRQKTRWRQKSISKENAESMSERDQKVAKMVLTISCVFISCFFPLGVIFIGMIVEPRISINGQYKNILVVFGGFSVLLEGTNSALNFFIYYHMSSKYRLVFQQLFRKNKIILQKDDTKYHH